MVDPEGAAPPRDGPHPEEAEAQREETVMPWVLGGAGLLAVAAVIGVLFVVNSHGHVPPNPPAAAPVVRPPGQG